MEYELQSLLLMRCRSIEDWQSRLSAGTIEDRIARLLAGFSELVEGASGRVRRDPLGRWPESFLATFGSPSAALSVARGLAMHYALPREDFDDERVLTACAVNTGEVAIRGGKIIGAPLDVVSRLEHLAGDGEVLFTEAVLLSIGRSAEYGYDALMEKIGSGEGPGMRAYRLEIGEV